jgi:hypothetical protein
VTIRGSKKSSPPSRLISITADYADNTDTDMIQKEW